MKNLRHFFFPVPVRTLSHARAWNIAFRTAHIAATGILFGGCVLQVEESRLLTWLYLSLLTGIGLVSIEAYPSCRWVYQGRGAVVLVKLVLLCLIPWFWNYRSLILVTVVVIASVGSHMPGRFRYYSLIHRRVLDESVSRGDRKGASS